MTPGARAERQGAWWSQGPGCDMNRRIVVLYLGLAAANLAAWTWAVVAFSDRPALLAAAAAVYALGLRHALDADHIAAIDNVTRRLVAQGGRPLGVGLYFALGHSTIVAVAAVLLATSVGALDHIGGVQSWGSPLGTIISATFLLSVAAVNARSLRPLVGALRRTQEDDGKPATDRLHHMHGGVLQRLLAPMLRLVSSSWHMFPLGFLFGIGFDTATEIAMFGVAGGAASQGASLATVLVFPALFASAMALVDTTDGVMMLKAYGWALVDPRRKLKYNLVVTALSVCVAVLVAGIQLMELARSRMLADNPIGTAIDAVADRMNLLGAAIAALFVVCWAVSRAMRPKPTRRV